MTQGSVSGLRFPCITKSIVQAPKWQPTQVILKDYVTPTERKKQDTNVGFCHWQLGNAEQVEERNVYASFLHLIRGVCLSVLPSSIEPAYRRGWDSGQLFGWFSHSQRASSSDVRCYHQRRSSIQSQRCTVTKRGRHSCKTFMQSVMHYTIALQILLLCR